MNVLKIMAQRHGFYKKLYQSDEHIYKKEAYINFFTSVCDTFILIVKK